MLCFCCPFFSSLFALLVIVHVVTICMHVCPSTMARKQTTRPCMPPLLVSHVPGQVFPTAEVVAPTRSRKSLGFAWTFSTTPRKTWIAKKNRKRRNRSLSSSRSRTWSSLMTFGCWTPALAPPTMTCLLRRSIQRRMTLRKTRPRTPRACRPISLKTASPKLTLRRSTVPGTGTGLPRCLTSQTKRTFLS